MAQPPLKTNDEGAPAAQGASGLGDNLANVNVLKAAPGNSLGQLHGTVAIPPISRGFVRTWWAFVGPAILISVGYMDPGNWSTDLAGGAQFQYQLLWVVALSSAMAVILQICAAKLGVATGRDLAQLSHDRFWKWTRLPNWISAEIAIAACDLAEALGSALAINLLFGIPLFWALIITAFDVVLLLTLQGIGVRMIEAIITVLVLTIGVCYIIEIFILPATRPDLAAVARATIAPNLKTFFAHRDMLFVAMGIIGATVMPHNLYLHSALVQSRRLQADDASIRRAIKYNTLDCVLALTAAFVVNAAILVLAGLVFFGKSGATLPDGRYIAFSGDSDWIRVAFLTLTPLLGAGVASLLFAVALLASGQSSTITGTLAGQVVMEGFMNWRIRPWVRRLFTRVLAIVPAILLVAFSHKPNINNLLNLSQVLLAIQLPLAMVPLMIFTSSRKVMGAHRNGWFLMLTGWACCIIITGLDIYGLPSAIHDALAIFHG